MTTYALIGPDGAIDQIGALPTLWLGPTRWHDWRGDPAGWATQPADWGWLPVVEVPRPADTETHTSDPAPVALVDGVPTRQWTVRPWTVGELAAHAETAAWEAQQVADRAALDALATTASAAHTDGEPWVQPTGAHDAVPLGATVTHGGKTWESLIPFNVWEPGDLSNPVHFTLWAEVGAEASDDWNPNGHAYTVGDEVVYLGARYRCQQAHTSQPGWTPAAVPALWKVV